jgi:hypothetical protein
MSKPIVWTLVTILLLVPWVGTLWTGSFNKRNPTFAGVPFFYWYQLMWIPLSVITTGTAYLLLRRYERSKKKTGE